jgi:hypothetical protein
MFARAKGTAMSQFVNPPETPGSRVGDDMQKAALEAAQHEHLVKETEEIHREEAAEEGKTSPKRPWWKFWG